MNEIATFLKQHNFHSEGRWKSFTNDCCLILGFMEENGIPLDFEHHQLVRALHAGEHPGGGSQIEISIHAQWVTEIQSIKIFPTYEVLLGIKDARDEAIRKFIAQFD